MTDAPAPTAARAGTSSAPGASRFHLIPLLERRQAAGTVFRAALYVAALALAAVLSVALLAIAGVAPPDLGREISAVAFSSPRALASVLVQAAPFIVAGLATAVAFRAGFWNIGLEGQMILGAIFAAFIAIHDIGPDSLRLILMALAAALGGMVWIAGPGYLKHKLGVNEIITTLLLNYVAFNLLLHLVYGPWQDPETRFPHTEQFGDAERLARLGWQSLTWALPFAAVLAAVLWWVLAISRVGYLVDLMRDNADMARAVGVPVLGLSAAAILGSGALGGLTGFVIATGIEGRVTENFFIGYLFSGVLIAFLGRNNPIGVVAFA
ncbi:MAG: ABC transporter permease, partial [Pseudomonadota bacterium]